MARVRRALLLVPVLALTACAGTSAKPSSSTYTPPISAAQTQALIRPLMREDVSDLTKKDDATIDRVAVQQCNALAKEPAGDAYLLLLKGDLLAGVPAGEAAHLIVYAVRGWCPDQQYKLPPA